MEHRVPGLSEFATTVMTMLWGGIIACGTNHEGLGTLRDGETVEIEIQGIGRMALQVSDPLKRTWERGIYIVTDSTHPDALHRAAETPVLFRLLTGLAYGYVSY